MTISTKYKLAAFALPTGEMTPGFLIPVFESANKRYVQEIDPHNHIKRLCQITKSDPILQIDSLNILAAIKLVRFGAEFAETGNEAIHAFFDKNTIYIGTHLELVTMFNLIESQILQHLESFPYSLAGLYDFIGYKNKASALRKRQHVEFSEAQKQLTKQNTKTPVAKGSESRKPGHFRTAESTQDFVEDAQDFYQKAATNYLSTDIPRIRRRPNQSTH